MADCWLTALLVCLFVSTGRSQGFTIEPAQSELYVPIGGDAVFTVRPSNAMSSGNWNFKSKAIVSWFGTNLQIHPDYTSRVNLNFTTGSLLLKSVNESDNGDYKVTVIAVDSTVASATITLQALEPVANVNLRSNNSEPVEQRDSVVLTCSSRGSQLKREWLLNNQPIQQNDRINISGDTLIIDPVNRVDTGVYKCIVSNGLNSDSAETNLVVLYNGLGAGAIAGIAVVVAVAVAVLCVFICYLMRKKSNRPKAEPGKKCDANRSPRGQTASATDAEDGLATYENLPGKDQRTTHAPEADPTYMGLKLDDRSVYSELRR